MFIVLFPFLREGAWCQSCNPSASVWFGAFSDAAVFCPLWLWRHNLQNRAQRVLVPIWTWCILSQCLCCTRRQPGWMPGWCQRWRSTEMGEQHLRVTGLLWCWALFLRCGHMWAVFLWNPQLQDCRGLRWDHYMGGSAGCCFGCKCYSKCLPGLDPKGEIFELLRGYVFLIFFKYLKNVKLFPIIIQLEYIQ